MFNPIEMRRRMVQERIEKSFDNEIEKAHKDGDMHPNGKWVWVSSAAGGKGDWRTINGRAHQKHNATQGSASGGNTPEDKEYAEKFKKNMKDASDDVLNKVISGKIQGTDADKRLAKEILDERKSSAEGEKSAKKIIDLLKVSSSKYSDIKKVTAFKTDKGNWAIDYDGANTGLIIGKDHLSDAELKSAGVKIEGGDSGNDKSGEEKKAETKKPAEKKVDNNSKPDNSSESPFSKYERDENKQNDDNIASVLHGLTNDFLDDYFNDWVDDEDKEKLTDEQLNLLEQLKDIYNSSDEDEVYLKSMSNNKTNEKKIAKIIADAEKNGSVVIEYGDDKKWNAIIMSKDKFEEIDLSSSNEDNGNNYPAPNKVKITGKQQQQLNEVVDKGFLISKNTYNDTSKMKLERTPKGNWRCYYDGKDTGNTIDGKLMSESLARKLDMYQAPVFTGNVSNAIKSSGLFSDGYSYGKMGKIASINVGEPNTRSGDTPVTVIYQTGNGSYKSVSVNIDAEGKVEKESGWQSSQSFADLDDAKSYVEYGRRGRNTFNLKWEDSAGIGSTTKNNQGKTGDGFNIVGARAKDVADNVASSLGGKVVGEETIKVSGVPGATIKAYKVKVGNDSFYIHDGVYERSYSQKGYARYKGFTVVKGDEDRYMKYKVNSAGNRFTNAYSSTAGELGDHIKNTWGYGK